MERLIVIYASGNQMPYLSFKFFNSSVVSCCRSYPMSRPCVKWSPVGVYSRPNLTAACPPLLV